MKYPKIVKALDKILYLIESKEFLSKEHRKQLQTATPSEIQNIT